MIWSPSITVPSTMGLGLNSPPADGQETFVIVFVCPSHFSNAKVCERKIAIKAFEYRNNFDAAG